MRYGGIEWQYAEPIARALVESQDFRSWVLRQTRFDAQAEKAELLHREMKAHRSPTAESWWRSHFTEKCRCAGCSGQETDLLAVFRTSAMRFAVHFEIKRPGDRFPSNKDQARNYALRAECWVRRPPRAVLPHQEATTALVFSEDQRDEFATDIEKFGASLTFERISKALPQGVFFPET